MPDKNHPPITLADLRGRNFVRPWEAAQLLRVDVRTLRRAVADGDVPATRIGRDLRIPVAWLAAQLRNGTQREERAGAAR